MAMEKITENGVAIALVTGTCALTDEQTALDLIMEARYTLGAERIAIEKAAVSPDFFILSTALPGPYCKNSSITAQSWRCTAIIPDIPASPCGILSARATGAGMSFSPPPGRKPSSVWPGCDRVRRGSRGRFPPRRARTEAAAIPLGKAGA